MRTARFGFEKLFKGTEIDYAADIQPWLGDRYAVAVVPGADKGDAPRFEVVLQTTDEAAAQASLTRLIEESRLCRGRQRRGPRRLRDPRRFGVLHLRGAPRLTTSPASSRRRPRRPASQDSDTYQNDIKPFGNGIATMWADNEGISSVVENFTEAAGMPTAGTEPAGQHEGLLGRGPEV